MRVDVRDHIQTEIFDYQTLTDALEGPVLPQR